MENAISCSTNKSIGHPVNLHAIFTALITFQFIMQLTTSLSQ
uniref:Uncharacterized protein n=1 Tax=Acrobeloides nanus TaxID=290746 RepID=A0A914CEW8_9BILA